MGNLLIFRLKTSNWEHHECGTFYQRNQHLRAFVIEEDFCVYEYINLHVC